MELPTLLQQELKWLDRIVRLRIEFPDADLKDFDLESFLEAFPQRRKNWIMAVEDYDTRPPQLEGECTYSEIAVKCEFEERLLLILALSTHIAPGFITELFEEHHCKELINKAPHFRYLTGLISDRNNGIHPTGRFWIYLLSGNNTEKRLELINQLNNAKFHIINSGIVDIGANAEYEPLYGGKLIINSSVVNSLLSVGQYH